MATKIERLWRNQSGATAIEYGLIAALIALVLLATLAVFQDSLSLVWGQGTGSAADVIGRQADTMS